MTIIGYLDLIYNAILMCGPRISILFGLLETEIFYGAASSPGCLLSPGADDVLARVRTTRVVLAAAHRDHDTSNNANANLAAFCQRCHMIHDRPEHRRRRWFTLFRRKAMGDLFRGPYP